MARTFAASSLPTSAAARSKEMFSSWPEAAFVAGVKIGSGRRSDSCKPEGSGMPQIFPDPIVLPTRPGDVTAHDAFDRQRLGLSYDHRAAREFGLKFVKRCREIRGAENVIGDDIFQ